MILHYREYAGPADAEALLILHGLYGQQGNWAAHAKALAEHFRVFALDARNHGQSPWADSMHLEDMAADIADTMAAIGLGRARVLGHSMGGKAAMLLALHKPELVERLLVVDIAPVAYPRGDSEVLEALQALNLGTLASRREADASLAAHIDSKTVRDFLLANLQREGERWRWRFNLPALAAEFRHIIGWPEPTACYDGPVLFIRGTASDYIVEDHWDAMRRRFPAARVLSVQGAGHWVHSEKPDTFRRLALRFLQDDA